MILAWTLILLIHRTRAQVQPTLNFAFFY